MRKGLVQAVVVMGLLTSCKDGKMQNVFASEDEAEEDSVEMFVGDTLHLFDEVEEPPASVDELFVDFFYNFAGDAHFQNQRIAFPLLCKDGEEETKLTKHEWNEWNQFGEQDFYSVIYEREQALELQNDTTIQSVDVEWIHLKEGKLEKYGFDRVNGKWMLTELQTERSSETPNGDFLQFYSQFVADSVFQREALAVPVRLILTSADEEEDVQEETLSADDWFNLRADLPFLNGSLVNLDYGQTCISQNRKTLMMQGLSNGLLMKFRFNKEGDDWKLIEIEY